MKSNSSPHAEKKKESKENKKVKKRHFRRNWKQISKGINQLYFNSLSPLHEKDNDYEWHESNGQRYLEVHASDYYHLGLLEGTALGPKIRALKLIIKAIATTTKSKGYNYKRFIEMAKEFEEKIPDEFLRDEGEGTIIDEIQGMADSLNGISFEDIFLQNCFIDIIYGELIPFGAKIPSEYEFGCTTFGAVKNNHQKSDLDAFEITEVKEIYMGQNFDFNLTFRPVLSWVLHKVANRPRIFSLRMGGILSLPTGLNEFGYRSCINVIKTTIPGEYTIPSGVLSRIAFTYSRSVEDAESLIFSHPMPNAFNLMISDGKKLLSYECLPTDFIRYEINEWYTTSNTVIAPEFQQFLAFPEYSKERQKYAEKIFKEYYEKGLKRKDIMRILADEPVICRNKLNFSDSRTLAFISNDYFGLGNPADDSWGFIPIEIIKEVK